MNCGMFLQIRLLLHSNPPQLPPHSFLYTSLSSSPFPSPASSPRGRGGRCRDGKTEVLFSHLQHPRRLPAQACFGSRRLPIVHRVVLRAGGRRRVLVPRGALCGSYTSSLGCGGCPLAPWNAVQGGALLPGPSRSPSVRASRNERSLRSSLRLAEPAW